MVLRVRKYIHHHFLHHLHDTSSGNKQIYFLLFLHLLHDTSSGDKRSHDDHPHHLHYATPGKRKDQRPEHERFECETLKVSFEMLKREMLKAQFEVLKSTNRVQDAGSAIENAETHEFNVRCYSVIGNAETQPSSVH